MVILCEIKHLLRASDAEHHSLSGRAEQYSTPMIDKTAIRDEHCTCLYAYRANNET